MKKKRKKKNGDEAYIMKEDNGIRQLGMILRERKLRRRKNLQARRRNILRVRIEHERAASVLGRI